MASATSGSALSRSFGFPHDRRAAACEKRNLCALLSRDPQARIIRSVSSRLRVRGISAAVAAIVVAVWLAAGGLGRAAATRDHPRATSMVASVRVGGLSVRHLGVPDTGTACDVSAGSICSRMPCARFTSGAQVTSGVLIEPRARAGSRLTLICSGEVRSRSELIR